MVSEQGLTLQRVTFKARLSCLKMAQIKDLKLKITEIRLDMHFSLAGKYRDLC